MVGGRHAPGRLPGAQGDHRPDQEAERPPARRRHPGPVAGAHPAIQARLGLSSDELTAIRELATVCEEAGGQDLKITLRPDDRGPVPGQFLAVADGAIVAYAGVDQGQDLEVCGMVHPGHRRAGLGNALLDAAVAAGAEMGRRSLLVICEEAAPWAIDWMRRRGGHLDSSELRMVLQLRPGDAASGEQGVVLRRTSAADRAALRHLLGDGFPGTDEATLDMMLGRHDTVDEESILAWAGDRPVGTLRVIDTPDRSMVYGLVVDSAVRGRGYGGAIMRAALDQLRARGVTQVSLEVLPENLPAVRLYTRLGFREVTTYRYMRLATPGRRLA